MYFRIRKSSHNADWQILRWDDGVTEVQMTEVEMSTEDVVSFDGPLLFMVRSGRH